MYHLEVLFALSFYLTFFSLVMKFWLPFPCCHSASDLSVQPSFRGGYLAFTLLVIELP